MLERAETIKQNFQRNNLVGLHNFDLRDADSVDALDHAFSSIEGTQAIVAALWKVVLDLPRLDLDETLSELGASSLQMCDLLFRIAQTFERQLSIVQLLTYPSARAMALWLHSTSNNASPEIDGLSPTAVDDSSSEIPESSRKGD